MTTLTMTPPPSHSMPSRPHSTAPDFAARLKDLEAQIAAWRLNWEQSKADFQRMRGNPPPEESLINALEAADLENAHLRLELAAARHQLMQASHVQRRPPQPAATAPVAAAPKAESAKVESTREVKSESVDWDLNTSARVKTGFEKSIFGTLRGSRGG